MPVSETYKTFVEDLFSGFGPVTIRNMFGGAGVYHDSVMFAIIDRDRVYLKADETTRADFEAEGMGPFTYRSRGKPVALSYWEVPEALYDDADAFAAWAGRAFDAALRSRKS